MSFFIDLQKWRDASPKQTIYLSLLTIFALVAVHNAVFLVYQFFLSPLRKVPGPFLARITQWWEYVIVSRGKSHLDYIRLHEEYGEYPLTVTVDLVTGLTLTLEHKAQSFALDQTDTALPRGKL